MAFIGTDRISGDAQLRKFRQLKIAVWRFKKSKNLVDIATTDVIVSRKDLTILPRVDMALPWTQLIELALILNNATNVYKTNMITNVPAKTKEGLLFL